MTLYLFYKLKASPELGRVTRFNSRLDLVLTLWEKNNNCRASRGSISDFDPALITDPT